MNTAKIHSIRVEHDSARVNPGVLHQDVQDKRESVSGRLTYVNGLRLRNSDERKQAHAIIAKQQERLEALDLSDKALDSEREELIAIDDALSEEGRKLERIIVRRAGE